MRRGLGFATMVVLLGMAGCRQPAPPAPPLVRTPPAPPPFEEPTRARLLGVWTPTEGSAAGSHVTFNPDGTAIFEGGLAYYNPASWRLDTTRHELALTMLQAPNDKLDIFHMQIGEGVKAFDRKAKQVTLSFDANTSSLNIAGWTYEKPTATNTTAAPAEPILK